MKSSFYNFLVPHTELPGTYILFNAFSKAMFLLDEEEKARVEYALANPNDLHGDLAMREMLIKNDMIIEEDRNELNMVRYKYQKTVYDHTRLALTIIPTFLCNFNCYYCYQNHTREQYAQSQEPVDPTKLQMTEEVRNRLYLYLEQKINQGVKQVLIKWFGGEPTMATKEIVEMTLTMAEICQQRQVRFESHMVTNGYMLDVNALRPILPYFTEVEITIDGSARTHDSRRRYGSGSSYAQILQNIKNLQEVSPTTTVSIRINLERGIADAVSELLEDLKAKGIGKIHLNVKTLYVDVDKYPEESQDVYTKEEFAHVIPELIRKAIKLDLLKTYSPHLGFMRCLVSCKNVFVVMPDAKLHKCYGSLMLDEGEVGEIKENGAEELNYRMVEWYTYDPLAKPECAECKYLPICMGGCCYNDVVTRWKPDCLIRSDVGCNILRYNFAELLSLHAQLQEERLDERAAGLG